MRVFLLTAIIAFSSPLHAQTSSPSASPSLEQQRAADLEAYLNNSARGADTGNASATSNISGPGPASNAWSAMRLRIGFCVWRGVFVAQWARE
jgi:hypothetical protein